MVKTPHTVPTIAMEMFYEPSAEALFSPLLQQYQYWRYVADAHREMVPERLQELLRSLGPPPQLRQRHQGSPSLPDLHRRTPSPPLQP